MSTDHLNTAPHHSPATATEFSRETLDERVDAALAELRAGRPVLVADSADRENEADVIFSAQSASTEWVAWTIRHSSGYLCAPMPAARADALRLPLMVPHSQDPRRTAYTVTVDAAHGVSTGISAADRALTLRTLADPAATPSDLIRPGHVLPLRAVPGGVLHRAGHTEAAVDLCRLAGLEPVAGIAELVHDDGTMVRLPEAIALAQASGLQVLTIADLVAWRLAHGDRVGADGAADQNAGGPVDGAEPSSADSSAAGEEPGRVHRTGSAVLPIRYGTFTITGYRDMQTGAEHVALAAPGPADRTGTDVAGQSRSTRRSGPASESGPTDPGHAAVPRPMVRVHSECLTGDAFGSLRCDCGPQLDAALARVAAEGGVVVYLRGHEGRGIGLLSKIDAYALQDAGLDTMQANIELGWPVDRREYGAAAAILADLGVDAVRLLTNNPTKVEGLRAHGIAVEQVGLEVGLTEQNAGYLRTKGESMGHLLSATPPHGDPLDGAAQPPSGRGMPDHGSTQAKEHGA